MVLVTGDGDFLDLADKLKERLRINIYIACFKSSLNEELIGAVGEENVIYLDDFDFKKEEPKPSQEDLSRRMMSIKRFSLTRKVDKEIISEVSQISGPNSDFKDVRKNRKCRF